MNPLIPLLRRYKNPVTQTVRKALEYLHQPNHVRLYRRYGSQLRRLYGRLSLLDGRPYTLFSMAGQPTTGGQIRVVCASEDSGVQTSSVNYLRHILFGEHDSTFDEIGRCPADSLWQAVQAEQQGGDLVILDANVALLPRLSAGSWVSTPAWVRMVLDYWPPVDWATLEKGFRSQRRNLKRFQQAGYSIRASHSREDLEFFYHRMYLPLIEKRHSIYSEYDTLAHMEQWLKQGRLLLVEDASGRPVAGHFEVITGRILFFMFNGVLDADPDLIDQGVLSGLYHHEIRWCYEQGFSRYDAGGCRPFLNDGVYIHKTRWGMKPVYDLWDPKHWLFWVPNGSADSLNWLRGQQFIPEVTEWGGSWPQPAEEHQPLQDVEAVS